VKIAVIGTGYVGLVTGTCFADTGIHVTCVDVDAVKIENLKKGILPIYEPGLEEVLERNMKKDRLSFTTSLCEGIKNCEVVFIAVGTPPDEDGSADLTHVLNVASDIGKYMENDLVVVTKSTVPVGTAKKVRAAIEQALKERGSRLTFEVVSNPEFLKEGDAINDFLKPDRIVVGVESPRGEEIMRGLYKPFVLNGHPIIVMDIPSAEMTKYAANAMLATRISFMNEIANLCEIVGADVNMVRLGIGSDPRIGHRFIYPGIGYGGSCFPKDVKALIKTAQENKYHLRILTAVEKVNEEQKLLLYEKARAYFHNKLKGKTIALWGLSFKPETDDMREAPSLAIIEKLLQDGCHIKGYDPQARKEAQRILGNKIELADDLYGALIDADCLLLLTEWQEFRYPNFQVMAKLMKQPVIFDGRNIYDRQVMREKGFTYFCIGVKSSGA
jgi:UDPglucose 6-dehydrogenase